MKLGRIKVIVATALTLFLSVAQSSETRDFHFNADSTRPVYTGFEQAFSSSFIAMDELGFLESSTAGVAFSRADEFGELGVIEMPANESTRMHFNFKSFATDELLSATLVTGGGTYALTFNLPSGQFVLENDAASIITTTDYSRLSLSENEISDIGNEHFISMLSGVLGGSDILGFSLSMAESLAENDLQTLVFPGEQYAKGDGPYTEGGWACAGAMTALAAANVALAAAIAATYITVGAAAAAIAAAVTAVGLAMAAVDMYCLQM